MNKVVIWGKKAQLKIRSKAWDGIQEETIQTCNDVKYLLNHKEKNAS